MRLHNIKRIFKRRHSGGMSVKGTIQGLQFVETHTQVVEQVHSEKH